MPADVPKSVDEAITSRHSVRAFEDTPVPRATVEHILDVARYAPSGTNIQPWLVYAIAGDVRQRLCDAILEQYWSQGDPEQREWQYYPTDWFEPFLGRRRACGWGLYGALGIERGEKDRMRAQRARNYSFFDAPVGLIFTIERRLERGSWMDLGMFIQNIMVAARAQGLHTCPQAAFASYYPLITEHLSIPDNEMVVCGMAIGYRDDDARENSFRTEREPVAAFSTWLGW